MPVGGKQLNCNSSLPDHESNSIENTSRTRLKNGAGSNEWRTEHRRLGSQRNGGSGAQTERETVLAVLRSSVLEQLAMRLRIQT